MIQTLKGREGRLRAGGVEGERNWPARIPIALSQYNAAWHRILRMAPNDVTPDNANKLYRRLYGRNSGYLKDTRSLLAKGAHVRIKRYDLDKFAKSNVGRNSKEVFQVSGIRLYPSGIKYKLVTSDGARLPIAGTWFRFELVPVTLPQL